MKWRKDGRRRRRRRRRTEARINSEGGHVYNYQLKFANSVNSTTRKARAYLDAQVADLGFYRTALL